MDLEKLNEDYKNSKTKVEKSDKLRQKVEELRKEIKSLTRQIEDLDTAKARAEEDGDEKAVKQVEEDLKDPLAKLKSSKQSLEKLEKIIKDSQKAVDDKIDELSKNPELKAHLNEVIGKRFSRQINHKQAEKEKLVSKNEQLETIKAAAQKDPYVMNTLKGIEGYLKKIDELKNKTLEGTDIPFMTAQDRIDVTVAETKLEMRRKDLATYFKGTISDEVINSITSYDGISKLMKSNVRQMKGIDKQIAHCEIALEHIGFISPRGSEVEPPVSGTERPSENWIDESESGTTPAIESENPNWIDENSNNNLPDVQPKWYQFIKRFRNWLNKRSADRASRQSEDSNINIEGESRSQENNDRTNFKDSMKYDIIKDYEAKLEQDLLKSAKAERKSQRDEESR